MSSNINQFESYDKEVSSDRFVLDHNLIPIYDLNDTNLQKNFNKTVRFFHSILNNAKFKSEYELYEFKVNLSINAEGEIAISSSNQSTNGSSCFSLSFKRK